MLSKMKTTLKPFCGEERERRIGLEDFFNQKREEKVWF